MGDPFLAEEVPDALDGERLDRLVSLLTGCSRAEATEAVRAGAVRVGGRPLTKGSHRVAAGDRVEVQEEPRHPPGPPEADVAVEVPVVHADDHVIVVDKPAGLVVHPGPGHGDGTLVNGLLARFPELAEVGDPSRPGIVHRLDRGTSGLMVVARTPAGLRGRSSPAGRPHGASGRYHGAGVGPPRASRSGSDRRPRSAARRRDPTPHDRRRRRQGGPHPLRRGAHASSDPVAVDLLDLPARDRPHPPDPGAPAADRPPGGRRRPSTVVVDRASALDRGRSCTHGACRSCTRAPASEVVVRVAAAGRPRRAPATGSA